MNDKSDNISDMLKNKIQDLAYKPSDSAKRRFRKRLIGFNFMHIGLFHFNIAYMILICSGILGSALYLNNKFHWIQEKSEIPQKTLPQKIMPIIPDTIEVVEPIIVSPVIPKKPSIPDKKKQSQLEKSRKIISDTIKITIKDTVVKKIHVTVFDTTHVVQ